MRSKKRIQNNKRINKKIKPITFHLPSEEHICLICSKKVDDYYTAISSGNDNTPIHFECGIKQVTQSETLGPGEKVIYCGSGCFGIVTDKQGTIRKRIQFEDKDNQALWRKTVSSDLSG